MPLSDVELRNTVIAFERFEGNITRAANHLQISRSTLRERLRQAKTKGILPDLKTGGPDVLFPTAPEGDLGIEHILEFKRKRFRLRRDKAKSLNWLKLKLNHSRPYALVFVGDPHLDDDGCNMDQLDIDIAAMKSDPDIYAINMGDNGNNWGGRLIRLWAEQSTSRADMYRLAEWFLIESGVPWKVWLHGNHEHMDHGFMTFLEQRSRGMSLAMIDWRAKFVLVSANGRECRVDAAHNHKGTSIYNRLHGQTRAALMGEYAHIYQGAHHHNFGLATIELDDGALCHLSRARGYKWIDTFGVRHGFAESQHGASVMHVVDPLAENESDFIHSFANLESGVRYLQFLKEHHSSSRKLPTKG